MHKTTMLKSRILYTAVATCLCLATNYARAYEPTSDHLHIGFRWQPFKNRPLSSIHDINLEIGQKSSYATFWYMLGQTVPQEKNADYDKTPSGEAVAIRHAVRLCAERGINTELVIWQTPLWINGGKDYDDLKLRAEDPQQIYDLIKKTVQWFGPDVQYYALFHEANIPEYFNGSYEDLIGDYVLPAAKAIRDYSRETGDLKIISTAGLSPSRNCKKWYKKQVENKELMSLIDNWAFNLSDYGKGYGGGGTFLNRIKSSWGQVDYMRNLLDKNGYFDKGIVAAESWLCWDGSRTSNGSEQTGDPVEVTLKLFGECLQRGVSIINLPWRDNNSHWSFGLTKRLDYNGAMEKLGEKTFKNADGGAPIVARKINLAGGDDSLWINNEAEWFEDAEYQSDYAVTNDPNHTHYYIWRWYAQLSAANHECVHHTYVDEEENDILLEGIEPDSVYRMSSYDRTAERFIVLIAGREQSDDIENITVRIPARIKKGRYFNRNERFIGEGFADNQRYIVRWTTENIDDPTGASEDISQGTNTVQRVVGGQLVAKISPTRRLTSIFFEKVK